MTGMRFINRAGNLVLFGMNLEYNTKAIQQYSGIFIVVIKGNSTNNQEKTYGLICSFTNDL